MATVGSNQIATALNVTTRRVEQLVHEGMPRVERGKYDLAQCMLWYIRYLQKALSSKGTIDEDGAVGSLRGERQALIRVQRQREELALAKDRGSLMTIQDHEAIVASMILETKARVMAVGPRVSGDLVGEESKSMIIAKLEKAHREALSELAKSTPRLEIPAEEVQASEAPARKARAKKAGA
jgi:hypothetical protein